MWPDHIHVFLDTTAKVMAAHFHYDSRLKIAKDLHIGDLLVEKAFLMDILINIFEIMLQLGHVPKVGCTIW